MTKYKFYKKALEKKREQKEYNQIRCVTSAENRHNPSLINFTSNDFLGLSQHPHIKKNTIKYVLDWGAGSTPSRLVTQHLECHKSVEEKLAELIGKETVLLFPSSYQIHHQALAALANEKSIIYVDRFSHNALIHAAINTKAKILRFENLNYSQLKELLENTNDEINNKLILSESLFGINGEKCDLKKLSELSNHYNALLYIDDSNSIGVYGKHGMGLASWKKDVDIVVGGFGKASGSFGAYIGCNALMREYLLTYNSQLLETTMVPPAILGAISGSLDLIPDMHAEREKIFHLSSYLREHLEENQWNFGNSLSHIIPLISNSEDQCQKLSSALLKKNILVSALRLPFTPQGTNQIRLVVNAKHSENDISFFLKTLNAIKKDTIFSPV